MARTREIAMEELATPTTNDQPAVHQFHLLVEAVRDYAIFMLDPPGQVTSWNAGAERIKGYRAADVIGQHFSCFYTSEARDVGEPQQMLQTALVEQRAERRDGASGRTALVSGPR